MSYILSALRKAENQRNAAAPAAERFLEHRSAAPDSAAAAPTSRWIILALCAVLALVLGYLVWGSMAERSSGAVTSVSSESAPALLSSPGIDAAVGSEVAATADPVASTIPDRPGTGVAELSPPGLETAPTVSLQPPAPVASRPLPSLNITGYIYFESDPGRSKLFVDGIVYRLHSRLAEGLVLTGFGRNFVTISHFGEEHTLPIR